MFYSLLKAITLNDTLIVCWIFEMLFSSKAIFRTLNGQL